MGILWRLLAPKGLKRARRSVRRAAHPVRTASWALSPKPVKQIRRGAFRVAHPGAALEFAAESAVVNAVRGSKRRRRTPARAPAPAARAAPAAGDRRIDVAWLPGTTEIPVAGLAYHAAAISESLNGMPDGGLLDAALIPEPGNAHDPNAVAVYLRCGKAGYLPRRTAAILQPVLAALSASHGGLQAGCPARVTVEANGPQIVLLINLAELGVDPAALQ